MAVGTPTAYLYNGQPGTADAALYTAGAGVTATFANLVAVNATSGAVTLNLSVHRAQSGAVETICSALSLPADSAVSLLYDVDLPLEEIALDPGDSLHGSAGAAASVTVTAF